MKYKIKFTLSGFADSKVRVVLCHQSYLCGMSYEVEEAIACHMLGLNGFKPFGPIQVALDAYHKMYDLVP